LRSWRLRGEHFYLMLKNTWHFLQYVG
jgi:hypothetical protein